MTVVMGAPRLDVADALTRAWALSGFYRTLPPDAPDLVPLGTLLTPESLAELLDRARTACGGCRTRPARTAAAIMLASEFFSILAAGYAGLLFADRRGLLLAPDSVALRSDGEGFDALTGTGTLLVLPGDPAFGHPGTEAVGTLPELHARLGASYADLLTPVVEGISALTRRSRRALWMEAADRFAGAALVASRAEAARRARGTAPGAPGAPDLGPDPADLRSEVDAVLAVAPPVLRLSVSWIDVTAGCGRVTWKRRGTCCLTYQTPRWTGEYCTTCPLIPEEETVRRVAEYLDGLDG
ncbi:hypothetical protein [Longispora urticae]